MDNTTSELGYKQGCMTQCPDWKTEGFEACRAQEYEDVVRHLFACMGKCAAKAGSDVWSEGTEFKYIQIALWLYTHLPTEVRESPFVKPGNPGTHAFNVWAVLPNHIDRCVIRTIQNSKNQPRTKEQQYLVLMILLINHPLYGATVDCPIRALWLQCDVFRKQWEKIRAKQPVRSVGPEDALIKEVLDDKEGILEIMGTMGHVEKLEWSIILMHGRRNDPVNLRIVQRAYDPEMHYIDPIHPDTKIPVETVQTDPDCLDTGKPTETLAFPMGYCNYIELWNMADSAENARDHWMTRVVFTDFKTSGNSTTVKAVVKASDIMNEDFTELVKNVIHHKKGQTNKHNYLYVDTKGDPLALKAQKAVAFARRCSQLFAPLVSKHYKAKDRSFPQPSITTRLIRKHLADKHSDMYFQALGRVTAMANAMDHSVATHTTHYASSAGAKAVAMDDAELEATTSLLPVTKNKKSKTDSDDSSSSSESEGGWHEGCFGAVDDIIEGE